MKVAIPCLCLGRKHDGDTVVLRDRLDFRTAIAMRNTVAVLYAEEPDADIADVMAVLTDSYLTRGIESWTLRDTDNKPLPASRANIRAVLMAHQEAAEMVGDAADELYQAAVMLPLLRKASGSSPATPTGASTSPPTGSSTTPPKRSKRSSTSTSLTVVTEATSPSLDGDSNLSPSSVSAT